MRADLALFFSTLAAIAIVGLIVRNASGSASVIREVGNLGSTVYGTAITGNPAFYERASH